jgi:hypothetical protein
MNMATDRERVLTVVRQELPGPMEQDGEIRSAVLRLAGTSVTPALERIDRALDHLERMREESDRKWEEDKARWQELDRKWWEESARWNKVHDEIMSFEKRVQSSITAIGARWGMNSESAWRNGLRALLQDSFGVKVENVFEFGAQGEVFGRADQVELDVVVHDGHLIILELKSSMSRPDMYIFERKIRFYERFSGRKADRCIVISPMIEPRAMEIARSFHMECFTHSLDIPSL